MKFRQTAALLALFFLVGIALGLFSLLVLVLFILAFDMKLMCKGNWEMVQLFGMGSGLRVKGWFGEAAKGGRMACAENDDSGIDLRKC